MQETFTCCIAVTGSPICIGRIWIIGAGVVVVVKIPEYSMPVGFIATVIKDSRPEGESSS